MQESRIQYLTIIITEFCVLEFNNKYNEEFNNEYYEHQKIGYELR